MYVKGDKRSRRRTFGPDDSELEERIRREMERQGRLECEGEEKKNDILVARKFETVKEKKMPREEGEKKEERVHGDDDVDGDDSEDEITRTRTPLATTTTTTASGFCVDPTPVASNRKMFPLGRNDYGGDDGGDAGDDDDDGVGGGRRGFGIDGVTTGTTIKTTTTPAVNMWRKTTAMLRIKTASEEEDVEGDLVAVEVLEERSATEQDIDSDEEGAAEDHEQGQQQEQEQEQEQHDNGEEYAHDAVEVQDEGEEEEQEVKYHDDDNEDNYNDEQEKYAVCSMADDGGWLGGGIGGIQQQQRCDTFDTYYTDDTYGTDDDDDDDDDLDFDYDEFDDDDDDDDDDDIRDIGNETGGKRGGKSDDLFCPNCSIRLMVLDRSSVSVSASTAASGESVEKRRGQGIVGGTVDGGNVVDIDDEDDEDDENDDDSDEDDRGGIQEQTSTDVIGLMDLPPYCFGCKSYIVFESVNVEKREAMLINLYELMGQSDAGDDDGNYQYRIPRGKVTVVPSSWSSTTTRINNDSWSSPWKILAQEEDDDEKRDKAEKEEEEEEEEKNKTSGRVKSLLTTTIIASETNAAAKVPALATKIDSAPADVEAIREKMEKKTTSTLTSTKGVMSVRASKSPHSASPTDENKDCYSAYTRVGPALAFKDVIEEGQASGQSEPKRDAQEETSQKTEGSGAKCTKVDAKGCERGSDAPSLTVSRFKGRLAEKETKDDANTAAVADDDDSGSTASKKRRRLCLHRHVRSMGEGGDEASIFPLKKKLRESEARVVSMELRLAQSEEVIARLEERAKRAEEEKREAEDKLSLALIDKIMAEGHLARAMMCQGQQRLRAEERGGGGVHVGDDYDDGMPSWDMLTEREREAVERAWHEHDAIVETLKSEAMQERARLVSVGKKMLASVREECETKLRDSARAYEERISVLESIINSFEVTRSEYERMANAKVVALKHTLHRATGRIEQLTQERDALRIECANIRTAMVRLREENDRVTRQRDSPELDEAERKLREMEAKYDAKVEEIAQVVAETKARQKEYEVQANATIATYKHRLHLSSGMANELSSKHGALMKKYADLKQNMNMLLEKSDYVCQKRGGIFRPADVQKQFELLQREFRLLIEDNQRLKEQQEGRDYISLGMKKGESSTKSIEGGDKSAEGSEPCPDGPAGSMMGEKSSDPSACSALVAVVDAVTANTIKSQENEGLCPLDDDEVLQIYGVPPFESSSRDRRQQEAQLQEIIDTDVQRQFAMLQQIIDGMLHENRSLQIDPSQSPNATAPTSRYRALRAAGVEGKVDFEDGSYDIRREYEENIQLLQKENVSLGAKAELAVSEMHKSEQRTWDLEEQLARARSEMALMNLALKKAEMQLSAFLVGSAEEEAAVAGLDSYQCNGVDAVDSARRLKMISPKMRVMSPRLTKPEPSPRTFFAGLIKGKENRSCRQLSISSPEPRNVLTPSNGPKSVQTDGSKGLFSSPRNSSGSKKYSRPRSLLSPPSAVEYTTAKMSLRSHKSNVL